MLRDASQRADAMDAAVLARAAMLLSMRGAQGLKGSTEETGFRFARRLLKGFRTIQIRPKDRPVGL
jgi:hypothetical protein